MKKLLGRFGLEIAGVLAGIAGGYLYWRFAGCTGGCPITSSATMSVIFGGLAGGLLFSLFRRDKK